MKSVDVMKILFNEDDGEGLNEKTVQYYVDKIENGTPLAAPVIHKRSDGKFGVVHGRHRLEAARRCGQKTFSAYIVEVDEHDVTKLKELSEGLHKTQHSPEQN